MMRVTSPRGRDWTGATVCVEIGDRAWLWAPPRAWVRLSVRHAVPCGRFGRFWREHRRDYVGGSSVWELWPGEDPA